MTNTGRCAVITGASTGIGRELARICAQEGHDLILAADELQLEAAADELRGDVRVETVRADLATEEGVDRLLAAMGGRTVDYVMANAGIGLSGAFYDQDFDNIRRVIDLNITGTTLFLHRAGQMLLRQGSGRILITGSIAGFVPGSYNAVYNASKAYLDSLSYALRDELKDRGVSVTCLMPGLTDTEFFDRADMENTPIGKDDDKDDPAMVARKGYEAMMKGQSGVVTGFMNKVQATFSGLLPDTVLAKMHRRMAEPEDAA